MRPPHTESEVKYPKLDITDEDSVRKFVQLVKGEQRGVDALINNAGLNVDAQYSVENVELTLKTNYYGTLKVRPLTFPEPHSLTVRRQMNQAFLPLVRENKGRIVNLSSVGSLLKPYSPAIQSRFRGVESLEQVEVLAQEYVVRPLLTSRCLPCSLSHYYLVACQGQDRDGIRMGRPTTRLLRQ